MQTTRLLIAIVATLATAACARQQPRYYTLDSNTGQPVAVVAQQAYAQQAYAQPESGGRGLFTQGGPLAQPRYAVPQGGPYVAAPNSYAPGRGER